MVKLKLESKLRITHKQKSHIKQEVAFKFKGYLVNFCFSKLTPGQVGPPVTLNLNILKQRQLC